MMLRPMVNSVVRNLLLVAAASGVFARADDRAELEGKVKAEYRGKTVVLRHSYSGDSLRYDRRGELRIGGPSGPWTLWAKVRITNAQVTRDSIVIKGDRLFLVYDGARREFRDVFSFDPKAEDLTPWFAHYDLHSERMQELMKERLVRIEIDVKGLTESESLAALKNVFLFDGEYFQSALPDYWREFLKRASGTAAKTPGMEEDDKQVVYNVAGDVSAPRARSAPDPEYSETARMAGFGGSLSLSVVVNALGRVTDLRITRPLGMGLDEKAVEAVRTWEFEPGKKDGHPVAVQVNVEVGFRLY